jgi:hypothetical protein
MISCKLANGLGNQLFQIATTLATAWDNGDSAVFNLRNHWASTQGYKPVEYQSTIFRHLIDKDFYLLPEHIFLEPSRNYQPIPYRPNMLLSGLFYSEKYFIKHRAKILDIFAPPQVIINKLACNYQNILSQPNCAIHVRRGDYLNQSDKHPVCSIDYYHQALKYLPESTKFIVISDDIEWSKNVFLDSRFSFSENNHDVLDLYLMSMCQHQIIANSTFSWWGSWLNQNPNKIIIVPKHWYGESFRHVDTSDIYTNQMVRI